MHHAKSVLLNSFRSVICKPNNLILSIELWFAWFVYLSRHVLRTFHIHPAEMGEIKTKKKTTNTNNNNNNNTNISTCLHRLAVLFKHTIFTLFINSTKLCELDRIHKMYMQNPLQIIVGTTTKRRKTQKKRSSRFHFLSPPEALINDICPVLRNHSDSVSVFGTVMSVQSSYRRSSMISNPELGKWFDSKRLLNGKIKMIKLWLKENSNGKITEKYFMLRKSQQTR